MKTQDIRSMGLAYLEVLEGKDAVNKHGHDRVGKEDDDVNNDKKVDSTDKYLLNRRKAISANIRKEEVEEVEEALVGNQHKIDANKNGKVDAHDFHLLRNKKAQRALSSAKAQAKPKSAVSLAKTPWNEEVELDEVSANTLGKYSIKAAQQGNKRVAGQKMADDKVRKKYGYSSDAKVAAEATEWTVFTRIQEKAAETKKANYEISKIGDDFAGDIKTSYNLHNKGAHPNEPHGSTISKGEKDFIDAHGGLTGTDSGISADKNADQNSKAVRASMKQAPGRHNDQKIGDKTPPKASA